jgi:hypothetical protein
MRSCGSTTGGEFGSQAPPDSRRARRRQCLLIRSARGLGASIGRRPVKRTAVRSIYAKINLAFVLSQEAVPRLGRSTLTPLPGRRQSDIVPLGVDRFGQSGGIAISTGPTASILRRSSNRQLAPASRHCSKRNERSLSCLPPLCRCRGMQHRAAAIRFRAAGSPRWVRERRRRRGWPPFPAVAAASCRF